MFPGVDRRQDAGVVRREATPGDKSRRSDCELVGVIQETMQPAHVVGLWLRPPAKVAKGKDEEQEQ
jgi:hypothetical protein